MSGEVDLHILGGDLAFGPDGEPLFLIGVDVVAQDIKHRLEESGLLADLVGDDAGQDATLGRIAFEVEEDARLRAGTAEVTALAPASIRITARTMDGSAITTTAST